MTYNLQEFKEWLEEEPFRKKELNWEIILRDIVFVGETIRFNSNEAAQIWNSNSQAYYDVVKEWRDLKNQERERE